MAITLQLMHCGSGMQETDAFDLGRDFLISDIRSCGNESVYSRVLLACGVRQLGLGLGWGNKQHSICGPAVMHARQ